MRFIDEAGNKYGKLLVVSYDGGGYWSCKCECGTELHIYGSSLRSGRTKTCGCVPRGGSNRLPEGEGQFRYLYRQYRNRCLRKKLDWELSQEQFRELTKNDCHYCGEPPAQIVAGVKGFNGDYIHNGVDRKDNSIGYTLDNCVSCCYTCNLFKRDRSYEEFLELVSKIYKYRRL